MKIGEHFLQYLYKQVISGNILVILVPGIKSAFGSRDQALNVDMAFAAVNDLNHKDIVEAITTKVNPLYKMNS